MLHHPSTRHVSLLLHVQLIDTLLLQHTVGATIQSSGQSVMLLFAFDYVVLSSDVVRFFVKYLMSMADLWLEGRCAESSMHLMMVHLVAKGDWDGKLLT